ncbi:MAG: flavin reductase [Pseudomonadota bacterium]
MNAVNPIVDPKELRSALGQFPTGVTVMTTLDTEGSPVAMTASSFNSVSMDPPLILWSVARSAFGAPIFENADSFVVNVLGKHQVDTSNLCARAGEDKFANIDYTTGKNGCPVIADTAAFFECRTWRTYDGGDHIIVLGEVSSFQYNSDVMPLVFAQGSYAISAPQSPTADAQVDLPEDGFLSSLLLYQLHKAYSFYSAELYPLLQSKFDLTSEEWRILSLVADVKHVNISTLARLVSQPETECRDSLERLTLRGLLTCHEDDSTSLTDEGRIFSDKLFGFAKQHEATALQGLGAKEAGSLHASLKTLSIGFNASSAV